MATRSAVDDRSEVLPLRRGPGRIRALTAIAVAGFVLLDQSLLRASLGVRIVDVGVAAGFLAAAVVWAGRTTRAPHAAAALTGGAGWCLAGVDPRLAAIWWPMMAVAALPVLRPAVRRAPWSAVGLLAAGAAARAFEFQSTAVFLALVGSALLAVAALAGTRRRAGAGGDRGYGVAVGLGVALGIGLPAVLILSGSARFADLVLAGSIASLTVGGLALLASAWVDPGWEPAVTDRFIELAGRSGSAGLRGLVSDTDAARAPRAYATSLALLDANLAHVSELEAQVRRSRALQRRLVTAADEQRALLAWELQSSVQPLLDRLSATLLEVGDDAPTTATREAAQQALHEISGVQEDLNRIAQGLHPRLLVERGLRDAIADLAARAPFEVSTRVPTQRFAAAVESALWYVCAEALTNAAKHSDATRAWLTVERGAGEMVATITDNGRARVDIDLEGEGSAGLAGVRDRISAEGGALELLAGPGGGLSVVARLPC